MYFSKINEQGGGLEKVISQKTLFPKCLEAESVLGVWEKFPNNTSYLFGSLPLHFHLLDPTVIDKDCIVVA